MVAHLERLGVRRRRVVVQRDGGEPLVAERLRSLGAEVIDVPVYRWQPPDDDAPARRLLDAAAAGRIHALTFTCAYAVGNAFALASDPAGLAEALNGAGPGRGRGPGVRRRALRRHGVDPGGRAGPGAAGGDGAGPGVDAVGQPPDADARRHDRPVAGRGAGVGRRHA